MIQERFEMWNREFDLGERPIPPDGPLPPRYAVAFYDHRGRLYRVVQRGGGRGQTGAGRGQTGAGRGQTGAGRGQIP